MTTIAFFACIACGEPHSSPPTAPTATASLDVPPLPPGNATTEKRIVRPADSANPATAAEVHDAAAAEAAFQEARNAMTAGDYPRACALYRRSLELDRAVGTLLNLGDCEERTGDRANALIHFEAAYDEATKKGEMARAAFAKQRADRLRSVP